MIFRRRVQSTVRVIISSGTENPGLRMRELREEHIKACREAVEDVDVRSEVESFVAARTEELEKVATSASLLREVTERTRDLIASFGERLSTKIFWGALRSMGVDAVYLE